MAYTLLYGVNCSIITKNGGYYSSRLTLIVQGEEPCITPTKLSEKKMELEELKAKLEGLKRGV